MLGKWNCSQIFRIGPKTNVVLKNLSKWNRDNQFSKNSFFTRPPPIELVSLSPKYSYLNVRIITMN